jgi:DNA-binding MarR family transcriptional regulator
MSLYLLGWRLMQVAEESLPKGKMAKSGRLVYVDVAYHPNSSITEITERTGFPQSLVSTSVARLREIGLLETKPDPDDRRRTLVQATTARRALASRLAAISIDESIEKELSSNVHVDLVDVMAALGLLSRVFTPEVLRVEAPA